MIGKNRLLLLSIVIFIVMLLLLIGFHELGHFVVARLCGIQVLRFSIGFGSPLIKWSGRSGIEYMIGWIPFGGYIKLVDEREQLSGGILVKRSIWQRFLVVAAGPLANFLLALCAFYGMCMIGKTYIKPIIKQVVPQSIAAQAGVQSQQQIVAVGHHAITGWRGVNIRIIAYLGEKGNLLLTTQDQKGRYHHYQLQLKQWQIDDYNPNVLTSLGIIPQTPRRGAPWPPSLIVKQNYTMLTAVPAAWQEFTLMTVFNAQVLWKLLIGKLSLKMLAGPITLFKSAEIAAQQGGAVFFELIGILSISLGLINLLPIPGLDGSQVVYLLMEKMRGQSFTMAFEILLFKLGLIFIVLLLFQATINDLMRWL